MTFLTHSQGIGFQGFFYQWTHVIDAPARKIRSSLGPEAGRGLSDIPYHLAWASPAWAR